MPNKFPALRAEGEQNIHGEGIYEKMNGIGIHEVIIESPRHVVSLTELGKGNIEDVLRSYRDRLLEIKRTKELFTDYYLKMLELWQVHLLNTLTHN